MTTIWKYEMNYGFTVIDMPDGAEIVSVQMKGNTPCIWAIVDPDKPKISRSFEMFSTGHQILNYPESMVYIGTCQLFDYAFHIFEQKPI